VSVALVNPPSRSLRLPQEHMGLEYLAAVLKGAGVQVTVIDAYAGGLSQAETLESLLRLGPRVVGFSPFVDSWAQTRSLATSLKQAFPATHVTLGGHLATLSSSEVLGRDQAGDEGPFDSVVLGEGEETLLDLAGAVLTDRDWKQTPGIAYRQAAGRTGDSAPGQIVRSGPRALVADLDSLPWPHRYNAEDIVGSRIPFQLVTSRGCYGRCTFCSIPTFYGFQKGARWRARRPENIVAEMRDLVDRYGARVFKIVDDSFVGPGRRGRDRALAFAEAVIRSGLEVEFRLSVRADDVDAELFRHLKAAGLACVAVGVEAAFSRALQTYRKGLTVAQNQRALEILTGLDIPVLMNFIVFDPYTTFAELKEQYAWLLLWRDTITHSVSQSLYVRPLDPITDTLRREKRLTSAAYPNCAYGFDDPLVTLVHRAVGAWTAGTSRLYYRVVENLMLPRVLSEAELGQVRVWYSRLKDLDLEVLGEALTLAEEGSLDPDQFAAAKLARHAQVLGETETRVAGVLQDYLGRPGRSYSAFG